MRQNFSIAKVIGHRGACGYAPENTLASMAMAHQLGVKWVEFDVMLTQDLQAIIIHDLTLDRTTNGRGKVAQTEFAKIAQLDAGQWFATEYAGEAVPTFEQLLMYVANLNLSINVEIKPTPGSEVATAQQTVKLLQQYWLKQPHSSLLISSASILALETVKALAPELNLGYITDRWPADWQEILSHLKGVSLNINHRVLSAQKVQTVKQAGYRVLAYTVNDVKQALELFSWGVDSVFSDFPDKILVAI